MNRQQRRRAEAQRRAYDARLRKDEAERITLPDDIKRDIAAVAQAVELVTTGGICHFRAITGMFALALAGIEHRHVERSIGGVIFRAGPDERRDSVAYCGPNNVGCIIDGAFLGHTWLRVAGELVDFSVGDWRHQIPLDYDWDSERLGEIARKEAALDPVVWTVDPPSYHWGPWQDFMPPANTTRCTPELGRAWYVGFHGTDADREQLNDLSPRMLEMANIGLPAQRELAEQLDLRRRVAAWRRSNEEHGHDRGT